MILTEGAPPGISLTLSGWQGIGMKSLCSTHLSNIYPALFFSSGVRVQRPSASRAPLSLVSNKTG